MIHVALGHVITARAFHSLTVRAAFDTIEKGYLIHWVTGAEVVLSLTASLLLTVVMFLVIDGHGPA